MNKNQIALASLSMDLKRIALGYQRGSPAVAQRFLQEALKRRGDIDQAQIKPYLRKLLNSFDQIISQKDTMKIAEDTLMYSILFQNASLEEK